MRERIESLLRAAGFPPEECERSEQQLGSTNFSYRFTHWGEKYVLRLGTNRADVLAINRSAERAAMSVASGLGIGASLTYFDEATGDMITREIEGRELTGDDFENPALVRDAALLLRSLHREKIGYPFDPDADIERRLAYVREKGAALHPRFEEAYRVYLDAKARAAQTPKEYFGLCHNDPFANNFLRAEDGRLYLIDYEYAGMGNVFYDIACLIASWPEPRKIAFLTAYFGAYQPEMLALLRDWAIIVMLWNSLWAYVKSQDIQSGDCDYTNFGHRILDTLFKIAS